MIGIQAYYIILYIKPETIDHIYRTLILKSVPFCSHYEEARQGFWLQSVSMADLRAAVTHGVRNDCK